MPHPCTMLDGALGSLICCLQFAVHICRCFAYMTAGSRSVLSSKKDLQIIGDDCLKVSVQFLGTVKSRELCAVGGEPNKNVVGKFVGRCCRHTESKNIPSWNGPTRAIKSNSGLHTAPPKIQAHYLSAVQMLPELRHSGRAHCPGQPVPCPPPSGAQPVPHPHPPLP